MKLSRTFLLAAFMAVQAPAFAHHVMGGRMPATFLEGLLSGLGHPVIGLDHFAAIVGMGALAAIAGRGLAPVLTFSVAMIAGVGIHLARLDVPSAEPLAAATTVGLGALVLLRQALPAIVAALLFAITGVVHGYALGESIVGAEPTPLLAYLAGLLIIQSVIAAAAWFAVGKLLRWRATPYAIGALVTVAGVLG